MGGECRARQREYNLCLRERGHRPERPTRQMGKALSPPTRRPQFQEEDRLLPRSYSGCNNTSFRGGGPSGLRNIQGERKNLFTRLGSLRGRIEKAHSENENPTRRSKLAFPRPAGYRADLFRIPRSPTRISGA